MSYRIDGNPVNSRNDWRQLPTFGGTTQQRAETFPGSGRLHVTVGEPLPPGVVITGFIQHATVPGLMAAIRTEAARSAATTTSTVSLNGADHDNQYLAQFQASGEVRAFRDPDDGIKKVEMAVRYVWQGVSP